MKSEAFPKSGNSTLEQVKFPAFGYVYLILTLLIQFVWGGMKAAKVLLMVEELEFTENEAVIIIHLQSTLMDIAMCIGYVLSTLFCGAYITCVVQELLKVVLTCPMCTLATMGVLDLKQRRQFYLYGQLLGVLTAFGNSSLASFLSDQFNQTNYLKFNRVQVVITLACSALGVFTVPHLIQYYSCFWTDTCYSMLWLCEWALCLITFLLFLSLCSTLERRRPKYSVNCMLIKLTRDASRNKQREGRRASAPKPLLEYSDMYSPEFRRDAQKILSMWTYYFPLAGYWALHSQLSTTWILQFKHLDGNLFNWSTVLPNELWGIAPLTGVALRMFFLTFIDDTRYPLRLTVFSQLIMAVAFMIAAILEKFITSRDATSDRLHMFWAVPQLLLVSVSDVILISSYRKFIMREVPATFRGVTQTLFVLSRSFGNAFVVLLNFMEMITGFPNRLAQFIIYASILNLLLIMFTVLNRRFERVLRDERSLSESGPSKSM